MLTNLGKQEQNENSPDGHCIQGTEKSVRKSKSKIPVASLKERKYPNSKRRKTTESNGCKPPEPVDIPVVDELVVTAQAPVTVQPELIDACTQTDTWCIECGLPNSHKCDQHLPVSVTLSQDHPYSKTVCDAPVSSMLLDNLSKCPSLLKHSTPICTPIHSPQKNADTSLELIACESFDSLSEVLDRDVTYYPETTLDSHSILDMTDSSVKEPEELPEHHVTEKKYLIFESSLDLLIYKLSCSEPNCGSPVDWLEKKVCGSLLCVKASCINGHTILNWNSQPLVGMKMPVGNLLFSSAILFSGLTYSRIAELSSLLNLQIPGKSTYYKLQKNILLPVIDRHWAEEKKKVESSLMSVPITLAGDGRCDSPGYSAKYCTYTLMADTSEKVVDFEVVQVTEAKSSVGMEKIGFEKVMDRLVSSPLTVTDISTDRHTSIRKVMREKYAPQGIGHQFDPHHMVKWVKKKLTEKARIKKSKGIGPWIKSVCNHLWWCARSSYSEPKLLVEKWESILCHVTNKHSWEDKKFFHACQHPDLPQERQKKWIRKDSPTYTALSEVVNNKNLVRDIEMLCKFLHTGKLESYHSLMNKYAPKRLEFDQPAMIGRMQLTALNHNNNTGRAQKVITQPRTNSSPEGEPIYRGVWSKPTLQWVIKPVMEDKTYEYLTDMMVDVVRSKTEGRKEQVAPHAKTKNIAKVARPTLSFLTEKHRSRFAL